MKRTDYIDKLKKLSKVFYHVCLLYEDTPQSELYVSASKGFQWAEETRKILLEKECLSMKQSKALNKVMTGRIQQVKKQMVARIEEEDVVLLELMSQE